MATVTVNVQANTSDATQDVNKLDTALEGADKAAEDLNTQANECVVFEDAQAGVEAAKNGNMFCIGVGDPDILIKADIIIPGFKGLSWQKMQKSIIQ